MFIKQLSKPIAKRLKTSVKNRPMFAGVCVTTANAYQRLTQRLQVSISGHKLTKTKPLKEEVAIGMGAELLSEFTVPNY